MRKVKYKRWYKTNGNFKYFEKTGFFHMWAETIDKYTNPPMKRLRGIIEDNDSGFVYEVAPKDIIFVDKINGDKDVEIFEPILKDLDNIIEDLRAIVKIT